MSDPAGPVTDAGIEIALSAYAHDRVGGRRTDEAWLAEVWADAATRVCAVSGPTVLLADDGVVRWLSPAEAAPYDAPGARLLLGEHRGVVHLAVMAPRDRAQGAGWTHLRAALFGLPADDLILLVHAVGLAEWHRTHRHCPRCGSRLSSRHAGHVLHCADCGRDQFPRSDPAVIMVVVSADGDRCLLGRQPSWPPGRYSTLAGFAEPGESLEAACRREVREEVGVRVDDVRYVGSQPWPFPSSLMVGFEAVAATEDIVVDGVEIEHARWFTREELLREAEAGRVLLPSGISISRSLIERWYGGPLPGQW